MAKKVAVLAVNPVNGAGLFQYLEAFFENGIQYKTFAVSDTTQIKTNSGISLTTDDIVSNLIDHEDQYDALVFACGDAVPQFEDNADKQYNQDMLTVIKAFGDNNKMLIGHCAAALFFDNLGIGIGKKVALHPFIKDVVKGVVGTDEKVVVADNIYTAQTENAIPELIPELLKALETV
ncbi:protease [Dysgonomonas sp. 521]|uniref:DJ-1/PfpI family protein n=1 Tax=Dysgonomonas sp. 521 TaxID=2302932 RepID=UPI0013D8274D|nr:DJ-1/PfpI family protein [Dysgonomonas sp. 521]NDV93789.1 protease [Dysgonomonas sp. 521]